MINRALAVALVAASVVSTASAQSNNYKKAIGVLWDLSQSDPESVVSTDAKILTTTLPPAASINNQTPRSSKMKLQFGTAGNNLPPDNWISAAAQGSFGTKVTCSRSGFYVYCIADATWLRTLTQQTTVVVEVGGAGFQGNLKPRINWVLKPAPAGAVFISQLTGPSSVAMGGIAQFTIRLGEPAPAGGQKIEWKLDPGGCFVALPGNVSFSPTSFNVVVVDGGQQYKSFSVGVRDGCSFTSAVLRTWTNRRIDQTPYYRTHSFTLAKPRR
ncbi:MAG: hypothetical protein R2882_02305 [Gemmatimonadales bacterium]